MAQGLSARSSVYQLVRETARRVARRDPTVRDEAEDIANDVVVALAEKEKREPGFVPDNPAAWASTAAVHRIIDIKRYRARRAGVKPDDSNVGGPSDGAGSDVPDDASPLGRGGDADAGFPRSLTVAKAFDFVDPKRASRVVLNARLLEQAMQELRWTKRDYLLIAMVAEGFSYAEIADRLGYKNEGSVRTMVARLRREAREVLGVISDWMVGSQSPP